MDITGKIIRIKETENPSPTFSKRSFLVEVPQEGSSYIEKISLEFVNDKCQILDEYNLGDEVTVDFNLKGRIWDSPEKGEMWFNTLQAWRIKKISEAQGDDMPEPPAFQTEGSQASGGGGVETEVPFAQVDSILG